MAKRGRPKSNVKTELVHLRLPEAVVKALRGSSLGLTGEARSRLAASVAQDKSLDKPTRDLIDAASWMAEALKRDTGASWETTASTRAALSAALKFWIEQASLPRWPVSTSAAVSDLFGPDDPETLGRSLARHHERLKDLTAKDTAEIAALHKRGKSR